MAHTPIDLHTFETRTPKRIAVIGAGFGGLSAAALLAKAGHDVHLYDNHDQVGGRARMWSVPDPHSAHAEKPDFFHFDMGPSWYLMPDAFETFFAWFNKQPSQYYTVKRLDPSYRIFLNGPDGKPQEPIDIASDLETNKALFDSIEPNGGAKLQAYLDQCQYQYNQAMATFVDREYSSATDLLDWQLAKEGARMRLFGSLDKLVSRSFEHHLSKKILEYTTVFLGGDPQNTPALYALISHVDFNLGVWYPEGGMNAVAKGLQRLAEEHGAQIHLNSPIEKILTSHNRISGVRVHGERIDADIVVSGADYHHTEQHLLDAPDRSYSERYWHTRTVAPSGFIVYLGLNKRLPQLRHHTLFLQTDWFRHFREVFDAPAWPNEPSYYVCAPSVTDPQLTPAGKEALFFLVPIAPGLEDTDQIRHQFRTMILEDVERTIGESIQQDIAVERLFTIRDFIQDYHSFKGTALGLSHTLKQTAFLRPQLRSKRVANLYYTGQYVHPGIGVPMTLIASQIAARAIARDHA